MKVALDVSAMPVKLAGAGRYVAALAEHLPSRVALTVVSRRDDGPRWRGISTGEVVPVVPNGRGPRLAYEALVLGRSRPARRADVWHAPHYTMPRRRAVPTVVTIHDLTFFTNPEWHESSKVAFFQRAIRYAARHADALVCVSDFTAHLLSEIVPTSVPVVVAPHGVDHQRFSVDDRGDDLVWAAAGLPSPRRFILSVGTVEPRKGLDVLLAAFVDVASEDHDVELWVVGQPGWGLADFDQRLAHHPYDSRIRRLGYVDDALLPILYRRCHAVAYPSRGEGFGLPVVEALACGAPVVTTADTVMAEVAGEAARLVPVGDAAALASALEVLMALSDTDRATVRDVGTNRAAAFTWDHSVDQHLRAYEVARG